MFSNYCSSVLASKAAVLAPIVEVAPIEEVESPLATQESTIDSRLFESWEELDNYLHSHYGYGAEIEGSQPSESDVKCLKVFYDNASSDDIFMIDSSWYQHSLFK